MSKVKRYKTIYLQVDEPEVSWCCDKINDTDIEYRLKADYDELYNLAEKIMKLIPPRTIKALHEQWEEINA